MAVFMTMMPNDGGHYEDMTQHQGQFVLVAMGQEAKTMKRRKYKTP